MNCVFAVTVQVYANANGRRITSKTVHCVFCKRKLQQISKHLKSMHSHEGPVKEIATCEDPNLKDELTRKLENLGNFMFNLKVTAKTESLYVILPKIIVMIRPCVNIKAAIPNAISYFFAL